jgi:hypothetical protein
MAQAQQLPSLPPTGARLVQQTRPMTSPQSAEQYIFFDTGTENRMRPVNFKPNGSLKGTKFDLARKAEAGRRTRELMRDKKHFMPGYTGFVRGMQHIKGRTYGESTRRAYDTDFRDHLCTSPIPSGPHQNRKIPQSAKGSSLGNRVYHLPGYTGHVPGVRGIFSQTYGKATEQEMKSFGETTTVKRPPAQSVQGYAFTMHPRAKLVIDSEPLPGRGVDSAPRFMIPRHLKYLRYMS